MRAIIYCRVSTVEQAEQGYSLDAQEKECRLFAINNGFEVDKAFVERGESAKTQNRTQLQRLIKYAVENKQGLSSLIIWKYDRLARNLTDQMELVKHFSMSGIRILSVTENNEDNSVGKLMRNIIGSFAQYENDLRSERTTSGMKQALQQGRWCWQAPTGYVNAKDSTNKPIIVPTADIEHIVEAFNLAESGLYTQVEIVEKLKKRGIGSLTKGALNRILRNPLYAGLIKVGWFPDYINAIHKPAISKETFFRVQSLLTGKRVAIVPKIRNHPDFPLRNFIRCPKCGLGLTGGWSTGRKKIRYAYYHCRTKGCSLNVRKEVLEGKFYAYIKTFEPNKDVLDLFGAIVLDVWKNKQQDRIAETYKLEKELKALMEKKNRITELIIKGIFDEQTYRVEASEVQSEILAKQIELNDAGIDLDDAEVCLNYCKFFLSNIADLWGDGNLDLKQRFQSFVFPKEIYYEGETFRTTATSIIFKQLQHNTAQELQVVAPRGFEPLLPE